MEKEFAVKCVSELIVFLKDALDDRNKFYPAASTVEIESDWDVVGLVETIEALELLTKEATCQTNFRPKYQTL
jgi:hypothetical protein